MIIISFDCCSIQLFPEGEVNRGGYIPRREAWRYISDIFRVMGANQHARKLLSSDLVNTNINYLCYVMFYYILWVDISVIKP